MSFYVGSTLGAYTNIKIGDRFNQTSCGSCINDYQDTDRVVKLACGHIFHESCYNTATGYRNLQGIKASCLSCVRESNFDPDNFQNGQRDLLRHQEIGQTINEELQEMRAGQRRREVENSSFYQILRMSDEETRQGLEFARLCNPVRMQECDAELERIDKCLKVISNVFKFAIVTITTATIGCLTLDYYSTGS